MREDLISDYSTGALHPAVRLLVDAQSAIDAETNRNHGAAMAAGGAFLESEAPTEMSDGALDRAMAAISNTPMEEPVAKAAMRASEALTELAGVPDPLLDMAIEAAAGRGWRQPIKGVQRLELFRDGDVSAELIRVKAGTAVPEHGHSGREYTLCLEGAFRQDGKTYGRGDLVIADSDHVHTPRAEPGEDVLVFAVTESPLRYRGVAGLLQKLFGFR